MSKFTCKIIVCLAVFYSNFIFSQTSPKINGYVVDASSKDTLIGVVVNSGNNKSTTTNSNGFYELTLNTGNNTLFFNLTGYKTFSTTVTLSENEIKTLNVDLNDANTALDEVVVSAGKYEQKLSEVTVSMDIIKPSLIENKNATNVDAIINQVPGVTVADGQASIRGGSGFSYGAGSRVLMLVDEMPMISADAGDIKWNYLPLENIEQIEVIKGASSALFGSSALNGVINLRTQYAKDKPITKFVSYYGNYDAPRKGIYKWWKGSSQQQSGINFSHAQKVGNFDLVFGGHKFDDDGFRFLETENRKRFNANVRYNLKKVPGLSFGVNTNMMNTRGGLFFLWQNFDSAYIPSGYAIQQYNNNRFNIDPYVTYFKGSNKFSLRNRYFKTQNRNDKNQGSYAELYYSEFQYQKRFANGMNLTSGAVYMEQTILGEEIYGNKRGQNTAGYVQIDKKFFNKLTISGGIRGEYYKLDTAKTNGYLFLMRSKGKMPFQPVARIGANYQAAEFTYIRASFGQGYRFPTVAEKFVNTSVGALSILPNTGLQPEVATSTEIGLKQGFKILNFKGFIDVAGFYTKYKNMIEFVFDIYRPATATQPITFLDATKYAAFKSQNVGEAIIYGAEISVSGTGKIGPINTTVFSGVTLMEPINPNYNNNKDTLGLKDNKYLKYRQRVLAKCDIQLEYKGFYIGYSLRYQSKTENIDRRFVISIFNEFNDPSIGVNFDDAPNSYILPGLKENFGAFQKSVVISDARIGCNITKQVKLSFIVNNIENISYQARPGDMRAPTQYVGQLVLNL